MNHASRDDAPPTWDIGRRELPILALAGLLGSLGRLPYMAEILRQVPALNAAGLEASQLTGSALVGFAVTIVPALWVGARLGRPMGWAVLVRGPTRSALVGAALAGLATGAVLVSWAFVGPDAFATDVRHPGVGASLLASASAGIVEEIVMRLGIMTLLVWVMARIGKRDPLQPAVAWPGNVAAALAFGLIHLPTAAAFGEITPGIVVFVLGGNGMAGAVFGWLYWRKGLLAAMLAHFTTDVVIHVIVPAL